MSDEVPVPPDSLIEMAGPSDTATSMGRAAIGHGGPNAALGVRYPAWRAQTGLLERYREVVGSSATFPLAFPSLIATAAHRDLMGSGKFPAKPLGIIHSGSIIGATGPLRPEQDWDIRAWVGQTRAVTPGREIDLWATADDGAHQWWVRVIVLSRDHKHAGADASATPRLQTFNTVAAQDFEVPEGIGRSYARLSGDYNPMHLHALAAKPFGFPRAIAHGWWLTAAIASRLGRDDAHPGSNLSVFFRRPVLLPSAAILEHAATAADGTVHFSLRAHESDEMVLLGGSVR